MKKEIINQQKDKSCLHISYYPGYPKDCNSCGGENLDALKHLIQNSVSIDRVSKVLNSHEGEVLTEDLINKIESEITG